MQTQKLSRKFFPKIYWDGNLRVGFKKQAGLKPLLRTGDLVCETTFYTFPSRKEANRFYDGLTNHPEHDPDQTGVGIFLHFVVVASYQSENNKVQFVQVLPE